MFVSPMLLHKSDHPFNDDSYITELKLDGIRLIMSKHDDKIKLYTRHSNEVTSKFPELLNLDIPDGSILDGELIVPGEKGKPDFEAVMEKFQSSKSNHHIQFVVFDVIKYNGLDKATLPLIERKELLNTILPEHLNVVPTQWIHGNGETYFNLVKENGLEGIVMKKDNSKYQINKRSNDWLKIINYQFLDSVSITGLRKDEFGLLLTFEDGSHAGLMEFMPPAERKKLYSSINVANENDNFKFIDPIRLKVKYRNLTKQGKLRIPSFVEWV